MISICGRSILDQEICVREQKKLDPIFPFTVANRHPYRSPEQRPLALQDNLWRSASEHLVVIFAYFRIAPDPVEADLPKSGCDATNRFVDWKVFIVRVVKLIAYQLRASEVRSPQFPFGRATQGKPPLF